MSGKELFEQGQELFIKKNFTESIEKFNSAIEEGYDPGHVHLSMGVAYLNIKEYNKAVREFSMVLEHDKDSDRAYYYRGICYLNKKDFSSAIADLNNSIARNKDRTMAYLARGIAKAEADQQQEAVEDFKQAVLRSKQEVKGFGDLFGSNMTSFDRSMALLVGERGPLHQVLTNEEIRKLKRWME